MSASSPHTLVDDAIGGLVEARALKSALDAGFPERPVTHEFLRGILMSHGIADAHGKPTARFQDVLPFRDLLETKLAFALDLAPDWLEHFEQFLHDPAAFHAHSRLMERFDYSRALTYTPENYEATRRWMRLTTVLTKSEAPACLDALAFDPALKFRALDLGGNSGELMRQLCARWPHASATVYDLPLVCQVGREHLRAFPEADHIQFQSGDLTQETLPAGFDAIFFKSILHDWPDADAATFLEKALASLNPGGTVVIFERLPLEFNRQALALAQLPILLFAHSYRPAGFYTDRLEALGATEIAVRTIPGLDAPFMLVMACKPH